MTREQLKNPELARQYARDYYHRTKIERKDLIQKNRIKDYHKYGPKRRAYHRAWVERNKDHVKNCQRTYNLKKKYGLSQKQFDEMKQLQEGKCAICFKIFTVDDFPYVDHDHETTKIRGLLCSECNLALGQFKDNQDLLLNAIKYLRRYQHGNL